MQENSCFIHYVHVEIISLQYKWYNIAIHIQHFIYKMEKLSQRIALFDQSVQLL